MTPSAESAPGPSPEIVELNAKLSRMRHDVNNHLALIVAGAELLVHRPEMAPRIVPTLLAQPRKITECIQAFSELFEKTFEIPRKDAPDAP